MEFSSKDHRRKDELLYQIMDWTNLYGAAVLIFSEEVNTDPVTGKIHRGGGGIGKLSALAKNIFHITSEADRKEPVDFKTSMSSVVLEDDDDDFSELDKRILAAAAEDIKAIESAPDWKPANHKEELAIYEAYMKNHPELKFTEGVILSNRRDHVMRLIAAEKKKQQKAEKKRAILANQQKVIQTYLPYKPRVSSEEHEEKSPGVKHQNGARVLLM